MTSISSQPAAAHRARQEIQEDQRNTRARVCLHARCVSAHCAGGMRSRVMRVLAPRLCVRVCVSLKVTHASEANIPHRRGSLQTEFSACGVCLCGVGDGGGGGVGLGGLGGYLLFSQFFELFIFCITASVSKAGKIFFTSCVTEPEAGSPSM